MRKNDTIAISVALVGVAMAILAWIAAPQTISYAVKVGLVLGAFILLIIAVVLPIRAKRFEARRRQELDRLSGEMNWAIHNLLNRPRPQQQPEMDEFSATLTRDYNEWCQRIDAVLTNRSYFTQSDLMRFQRLGFIEHVSICWYVPTDHTLSMLKLKLKRLQEVIDLVEQRP